eukprot:gene16755-19903_t
MEENNIPELKLEEATPRKPLTLFHRLFISEHIDKTGRDLDRDKVLIEQDNDLCMAGVELAFLNFAGTASQAWGLEYTTATRAGFLFTTINVLVPLGAWINGEPVSRVTWIACATALLGVLLIDGHATGGGGGMSASFLDLNDSISGDLLVLFGACCYALYTVRLSLYASKLPAVPLTAIKLVLLEGRHDASAVTLQLTAHQDEVKGFGRDLCEQAVFCTLWTTVDFFWTGKFAAE